MAYPLPPSVVVRFSQLCTTVMYSRAGLSYVVILSLNDVLFCVSVLLIFFLRYRNRKYLHFSWVLKMFVRPYKHIIPWTGVVPRTGAVYFVEDV